MQITVYYESWQMDCCGTPFGIGDTVEWRCDKADDSFLIKADYYYEAHDIVDYVVTGKVVQIQMVKCEYKEKNNIRYPISYTLETLRKAAEFTAESGFLVMLDNVEIRNH